MKEIISSLSWVDYLAFFAALRGAYVGYRSGLFPEFLRIAAYVITVIVTFHFYEPLAQIITLKSFLNLTTATAVAFIALLAAAFFVTKLITMLLLKLLKVGDGNLFYRLAGMVVGVCRWAILLSLLFMLLDYLPMDALKKDVREHSLIGPKISQIAPVVFGFLSHISPQLAVDKKAA